MEKFLVCLCVSLGVIFSVSGAMAGGGSVGGGKSIRNLSGTEGGNNVVSSNPIINLSMKKKIHSNSKI